MQNYLIRRSVGMSIYVFICILIIVTYVFYNIKRYKSATVIDCHQHNLMYIFIIVKSTPPNAEIDESVTFDASDSDDFKGDACEFFVWGFGDGLPTKTSTTPIVQHPYSDAKFGCNVTYDI